MQASDYMKQVQIPLIHRLTRLAVGTLVASLVTTHTYAATLTWINNATNAVWSNPANWSPTAIPADGDNLIFTTTAGTGGFNATNDLTGVSSPVGIVLNSITFTGARPFNILGNTIVMGVGATMTNTHTGALLDQFSGRVILMDTLKPYVNPTASGGSIRFNNGVVPYTGSQQVGYTVLGVTANSRTDVGSDNRFTGPFTIEAPSTVILNGPIGKAGAQIASAVSLNTGDNFFTYTGNDWDVAQVGQALWLPATSSSALLPLPVNCTITAVDTANKKITFTGTAATNSTSAGGWIGFPSSLGLTSNDSSNLVFAGSSVGGSGTTATLRYSSSSSCITDRGFTINNGILAQIRVDTAGTEVTFAGGSPATTGRLTKINAGTLILTGTNLFTGTTTVGNGGGNLYINSPGVLSSANVTVGTGRFGGNGTVLGSVTHNFGTTGSTNFPGGLNTVGTLTIGNNMTNNNGTSISFDIISPSNHDLLRITNTYFANGFSSGLVTILVTPTTTNADYTLIEAGTLAGTAADLVAPAPSGKTYTLTYDTASTPQRVMLNVAGVGDTTVAISSSSNPSGYLSPVVFTARPQISGVTASNATGTVIFDADGTPFYTNSVSGGIATATNSALPLGTRVVTATYSGDGNYGPSFASTNLVIVTPITVALTSSGNPTNYLSQVIFTSAVQTNGVTAGDATGTMVFKVGGVPFFTNTVSGGITSATNSALPIGTSVITATYSGDINYWTNSTSLNQVINPLIPTTPTNIVVTVSGGNLTLNWPTNYIGWTLQTQTNILSVGLRTNWFDVPGSASTNQVIIPINPNNPAVFYRMKL